MVKKNFFKAQTIILFFIIIVSSLQFACNTKKTPIPEYNSNAILDSTFNQLWHTQSNFIAGQNAFSVPFQNGKTLWLYAKSHINDKIANQVPCVANVQNAGLLQVGNTFQLLNGGTLDYIPTIAGEVFIPTSAYYYEDSIFIFAKSNTNNNKLFLATLLYPSLQFVYTKQIVHQVLVSNPYQYGFANASDSVVGFTYNYGIRNSNGTYEVSIARHSLDNPNKPWKYWTGTAWNENADNAIAIFSSITEPTCIRKLNGAYICITQSTSNACGSGINITFKYSPYAIGPFEGKSLLFKIPNTWQNFSPTSFGACLQPSFIGNTAEKRVLITYSLNGYNACTSDCVAGFTNPDFYSTYGFTVPLKAFNPVW
jgi:hypothetical protein